MAKLNSQTIVVQVSKLVRNDQPTVDLVDESTIAQLTAIFTELFDNDVMIEVEIANTE